MTQPSLYKVPVKMLGDLMSPRALEKVLGDAAGSRGLSVDALDVLTLEAILKNEVYKRLQHTVPAPLAKRRVMEVLTELEKAPAPEAAPAVVRESVLPALDDEAKKYSLYFDWPEMQRLRGVLSIARTEETAGRSTDVLVTEAQDLIAQMERKLEEGLVAQAQDLAELKATYTRVQGMGGRDVKRLESLIEQIDEAQGQRTLLPGEVERARNTSFKLRKSLESSVAESVSGSGSEGGASQARVQALEKEHATRQFGDLTRDFAPLLRARADLQLKNDDFRARLDAGELHVDALEGWRAQLEEARGVTLNEQRAELTKLEGQLANLPENASAHDIRVALDVAHSALQSGTLATDELRELRVSASALMNSSVEAGKVLEQQRELLELERSARNVPGAEAELAEPMHAARNALASGQEIDLAPLWEILEHHMGQAAQQRESFDARADHVVREYDKVRSLAGETTQRLGRLAEALRAQRRLGQLSAQARERYAQTLEDAEALLTEARAEYQAAQEVTSTFGQDALSDLLDVFDVGGDSESELFAFGAAPAAPTPTSPAPTSPAQSSPAPADVPPITLEPEPTAPEPAAPKSGGSVFDSLLGGSSSSGPAPTPKDKEKEVLATPPSSPKEGYETDWGQFGATHVDRWSVDGGELLAGTPEPAISHMIGLLSQADRMGLNRIDSADAIHVWSARQIAVGQWRVARARNWDALDSAAGKWLDSGQD